MTTHATKGSSSICCNVHEQMQRLAQCPGPVRRSQFAALSLTSRSQHWHSPVPNLDLTRIGLANNVADTRLIETFEAIVALEDLHV